MYKEIQSNFKAPISKEMGAHVKQVIPSTASDVDPFVFLDHFGPLSVKGSSQGVPPHPHAGIATLTYLFSGKNFHQDSQGNSLHSEAGDLLWMTAGRGIVHAEGSRKPQSSEILLHGLQIWYSLHSKLKYTQPSANVYPSKDLPEFDYEGQRVKVILGSLAGHTSKVQTPSPTYMYEFKTQKDSLIEIPTPKGSTCGLYLIKGHIGINETSIPQLHFVKFSEEGQKLEIDSIKESHFVILGGVPHGEPIVSYGPFVMNSRAQIQKANEDYKKGKFGKI